MNDELALERQLLEKLLTERADLDRHIAFLQKRVGGGFSASAENGPPVSAPAGSFSSGDLAALGIQKGEFYSLSRPQAAAALLRKVNKNLTTNQIFEALKETGFDVSGKNALNGLYTALSRSADIRKVAPNTWGLREWYPLLKETKKRVPVITPDKYGLIQDE